MRFDVVFLVDSPKAGARVTCYVPEGGRQVEEHHETMGWVLSDGEDEPYSRTAERLLAESDLWRAAPDLLAACKALVATVERAAPILLMQPDEVSGYNDAKAAIARAEGERTPEGVAKAEWREP